MTTLPPDPWKALGVDKSADKSEIRMAYKKLVLKCHPDKVQDPTLKAQKQDEFQKVQQAYELLNDDAERAKYEEQVKLAELRKQAAMMAKNAPNSSASRSSPRHYEIRTAEPRHKTSSSTPSGSAKVYQYASVHARSHEEMPSRYPFEDGEKHARRTASYEKPSRDEDRRKKDDRRRREEETDEFRIRERLREKEREVKEREKEMKDRERKKNEKERDRERRRGMEERHRRFPSPYIEDNDEEDQPPYSRSEKKRSPSNKPFEGGRERERQREKSTTSRRAPSPHVETVPAVPPAPPAPSEPEYYHNLDKAATYIEKSKRGSASSFPSSRGEFFVPNAPTPPPADADDELRAAARAAGRRSSHEASKSREKLPSSKGSPYNIIDSSSPKVGRTIPQLHKSHTSPLTVPIMESSSSPPRVGIHRSSTSQEYSTSAPKMPASLPRTQTWAYPQERHADYFAVEDDSEDDRHRRRSRRSSRRNRSPESPAVHTYKVDGTKTTRMDPGYGYGESPSSSRRHADHYGSHGSSGAHYPDYIKVKEAKTYGPSDVKYSDASYNVSYSYDHYNSVHA